MDSSTDDTDRTIIGLLQRGGRRPHHELAALAFVAPSTFSRRLSILEEQGIIRSTIVADREALGFPELGFFLVSCTEASRIAAGIANLPEVQEVHFVTAFATGNGGVGDSLIVKAVARSRNDLLRLKDCIGNIKGVRQVRTSVAMRTFKQTSDLPV